MPLQISENLRKEFVKLGINTDEKAFALLNAISDFNKTQSAQNKRDLASYEIWPKKGQPIPQYLTANRLLFDNDHKELSRALNEIHRMAKVGKQHVIDFIQQNGLKATTDASGNPIFSEEWNSQYNCYEISVKLFPPPDGTYPRHYPIYDGRTIKFRIKHRFSNNNFSPLDVYAMLQSKVTAAAAIAAFYLNGQGFAPLLRKLYDNFLLKTVSIGSPPESRSIQQLLDAFQARPDMLTQVLDVLYEELPKFTVDLAEVLFWQQHPEAGPEPDAEKLGHLVEGIKMQETRILSTTQREILFAGFPLSVLPDEAPLFIFEENAPQSDISSDDRKLDILHLSNALVVKHYAVETHTRNNAATNTIQTRTSDRSIREVDRSASVALLLNELPETEQEIMQNQKRVIAALNEALREVARDQIIKMIRTGKIEQIPSNFLIIEGYLTFLSPIVSEKMVRQHATKVSLVKALNPSLLTTLTSHNEEGQLVQLRKALAEIAILPLTPADKKYIKEHTSGMCDPDVLATKLDQVNIQHEFFAFNFIVGKTFGVDLRKADRGQNNARYNYQGIPELQNAIGAYLQAHHLVGHPVFNWVTGEPSEATWDEHKKELKSNPDLWTHYKRSLIESMGQLDKGSPAHRILCLYIQLRDYLDLEQKGELEKMSENSAIVESFFAGMYAEELARLLGARTRVTCKSGKDRTGLFMAMLAASAGPPELFRENLCNVVRLSEIKDIIVLNRPGARGVQVDADIMNGLNEYFAIDQNNPDTRAITRQTTAEGQFETMISGWKSREVGKLPNRAYECDNVRDELIRAYRAGNRHRPVMPPIVAAQHRAFISQTSPPAPPPSRPAVRMPPVPPVPPSFMADAKDKRRSVKELIDRFNSEKIPQPHPKSRQPGSHGGPPSAPTS